jgi:UTP--glucose-1-phosphate uridylyltransferase
MNSKAAPIRKAIFPVAGYGTRFLPATKASPKEMLPVVNKPLIQYAVEEAYSAGIREMIFVTSYNKRAIEDHFDHYSELENELLAHNKHELLSIIKAVKPDDMECFYVRQPKAYGLGHAILCAETLIGRDTFAVILADDLMIGEQPIMSQMIDIYAQYQTNILAVQDIPRELSSQYGIIQGTDQGNRLLSVQDLIEKPTPELAPSTIAIVGRYILSANIFQHIRNLPKNDHREIQLTDAIQSLLNKEPVLAYLYQGERYDCGSVLGFLKANVELGKSHPIVGKQFTQWLYETQQNSLSK